MNHDRIIQQIEQTFEEERRYLLAGDLPLLTRLAKRKESLMAALDVASLSTVRLTHLARLSARNGDLITAAQEGIRSASARLTELQRGVPASTYSANGAKSEFAKPIRTLQRRA